MKPQRKSQKLKHWHRGHFVPSNCIFNSQWPLNMQGMAKKKAQVMGVAIERDGKQLESGYVWISKEQHYLHHPNGQVRDMECPRSISVYVWLCQTWAMCYQAANPLCFVFLYLCLELKLASLQQVHFLAPFSGEGRYFHLFQPRPTWSGEGCKGMSTGRWCSFGRFLTKERMTPFYVPKQENQKPAWHL